MIHTKENFFNLVAVKIKETYFPTVEYYRDNKNLTKIHYALELFNNGCLTYMELINKLAKNCEVKNITIHNIVNEYIVSFGTYRPRFRK